jgi:3-hydroxyacyl-[acyl-carrier-protein] dehydratase
MTRPLTPHGPGFRFLDTFHIADSCGYGTWHLAPDLWFFESHFPGNPLTPAALLMEFGAQTAGAHWMQTSEANTDTPLFVASIDGMRLLSAALPGETLTATTTLVKELGSLAQFEFEITSAGRPVARGRVTLSAQLTATAR